MKIFIFVGEQFIGMYKQCILWLISQYYWSFTAYNAVSVNLVYNTRSIFTVWIKSVFVFNLDCNFKHVLTLLSPLWAVCGTRMGPSSSAGLNIAPLWPKVKMVFLLFKDGLEKKPAAQSQGSFKLGIGTSRLSCV